MIPDKSKSLPNAAACVFDLDGTLVDSLRDIAEALNRCLTLLGLPTHPVDRYRYLAGEGVPKLCQRAVGESHPHLVNRLIELVRPYYRTRTVRHTHPFPGIPALIDRLHARNLPLAVLSNKPHDLTHRVVRTFWPDGPIQCIHGYREEAHRKPSPHYLYQICRELDVPVAQTWFVGDTPTDIATARAARAVAIGVTWGFRPATDLIEAGAHRVVDHPEDLATLAGA